MIRAVAIITFAFCANYCEGKQSVADEYAYCPLHLIAGPSQCG